MEIVSALSSVALEVLDVHNYAAWRVKVKTYLIAQDLWETVKATTCGPEKADEASYKAWRMRNFMALHVIQNSCGPNTFSHIMNITSAKKAWNLLEKKYGVPKTTTAGSNKYDEEPYKGTKKAVETNNWSAAAKEFLEREPGAIIASTEETALHIAVKAGHVDIVQKLVDLMTEKDLQKRNWFGHTALVGIINAGNYRMARCIFKKKNNLLSMKGTNGQIPVIQAIGIGHIDLARYFYTLTPLEDLTKDNGVNGATLCTRAIYNRNLDIALHLIRRCPYLALALDNEGWSPFYALSASPYAFQRENRLVFWKRWIYKYCIKPVSATGEICLDIQSKENSQSDQGIIGSDLKASTEEIRLNDQNEEKWQSKQGKIIGSVLAHLCGFLGIKDLYEMKLFRHRSKKLLEIMWNEVSKRNHRQRTEGRVSSAIIHASKIGNYEFIFDTVKQIRDLLWCRDTNSRNIFSVAVLHRQEEILSLIYNINQKKVMTNWHDKQGNYILHMAGMTGASVRVNRIAGAAVQLQKELQWFKEVESIVQPKVKDALNDDGFTPRELFTKNHKDLLKVGEQWMKDTSTSCTVVGALIITIMFAAAFTIPGGNNQETGVPLFLDKKLFMVFIISDALSLFSSTTSVLMFLGILTSRYEEDDFLESLPRKMIIGLSTLFLSIAAMMIAFSTALLIMLHKQSWISIPVICLASVPITLFTLMQFPLLADMVKSTYGPSIFNKKKKWI